MDYLKLYYYKYFRYISGYSLIVFSALMAYMCFDLIFRLNMFNWSIIIFALFSGLFYVFGQRLIKTQLMINELYTIDNVLFYLRYIINFEHYSVQQLISLVLLADMYSSISSKKELLTELKWEIKDGHIEAHKILEEHIYNFKEKMKIKSTIYDIKNDHIVSLKLLENKEIIEKFSIVLKEDKMNFPMLIDLNKNHKFSMNDYYGKKS